MTIYQIIAICCAGPFILMGSCQLLITLFYKNQNTFSFPSGVAMSIGIAVLLAAFYGVDI